MVIVRAFNSQRKNFKHENENYCRNGGRRVKGE
jgi:hypothetical protein